MTLPTRARSGRSAAASRLHSRLLATVAALGLAAWAGAACAPSRAPGEPPRGGAVGEPGGEALVVPRFEADDPRISTAGFVRLTTRVDRQEGGTTHTLMIFAVGDVLTLGAMVEGPFDGTATWEVGDRRFSVPLSRANRGRTEVAAADQGLVRRYGGFDDFDWVNVEVPLGAWLPDGTPVRLEFRTADGSRLAIPAEGRLLSRVEAR